HDVLLRAQPRTRHGEMPGEHGGDVRVDLLREVADQYLDLLAEQLVHPADAETARAELAQQALAHRVGYRGDLHRAALRLDGVQGVGAPHDHATDFQRVEDLDAGGFLHH